MSSRTIWRLWSFLTVSRQLVIVFTYLLLSLTGSSYADDKCLPESENYGDMILLPPPDIVGGVTADLSQEGGARFASGRWLALACIGDDCALVPVKLKAKTNRDQGEYRCLTQDLEWDFSSLGKRQNIVIMLKPSAMLKASNLKTWYVREHPSPAPLEPVKIGEEVQKATPTEKSPARKSTIVPLWVENKSCTEQQEANYRCLRKSVRVQLQEGATRQWLGEPLFSRSKICYTAIIDSELQSDYVQWVGDLDNDQKPDYLLKLGHDGIVLFLSSKAATGQLVGEAGRYFVPALCD